jgi:hypothetical protein
MMIKARHIFLGAGLAGLLFGGAYLYKVNRLASELEVLTKAMIYKVSLSGIVLRVDVTLKNPTEGSIKVKHPFVKMIYQGATFASSEIKDLDYQITKFAQKVLEPIYISLSFMSLATTAPGLLKEYRANGSAVIEVKTVTTINNTLAYSKTDKIPIGNQQAKS